MPEVVFLPGFMQHADAWSQVAAGLGERYPSKVVDFETWTFEERLAEIAAASGEGDVLVGYSMGGRLGLHAALRDPSGYGGLVVIGTSPGIEDPDARLIRKESDEQFAAWIETQPIEAVVARWERNMIFRTQPAALVEAQRPGRLRNEPANLAQLMRTSGQGVLPSVWDRLGELQMPVLAMAGEGDEKYRKAAERMGADPETPHIDSVIIHDAGHAVHLEQPRDAIQALRSWLDSR
jgi:2-succinyl-6-hydroxy-2,4-cyclohexadiene-1-carboxylate synthase